MSKLFQAYKKRASGKPQLDLDLASLGGVSLFPYPPQRVQAELSQIANILLEYKVEGRSGTVICFASTVPGEGTSFVSYNIANLLAHAMHRRVAWIDANFKSPQRKLAAQGGVTFAELLQDPDAFDSLTPHGNLALVAGGVRLDQQIARTSPEELAHVLRQFTERFEYTLLDCPPYLDNIETGHLAVASDGLIAVLERKRLKREVIQHGLKALTVKKVNILGAVLNRRQYDLPRIIYDRL